MEGESCGHMTYIDYLRSTRLGETSPGDTPTKPPDSVGILQRIAHLKRELFRPGDAGDTD